MAWTDPTRRTARESTADLHTWLNTFLRDNLTFLKAPPRACIRKNNNDSIATGSSWSTLDFTSGSTTTEFDTDSMYDTANGRLKFTTAGKYLVGATVKWDAGPASARGVRIRKASATDVTGKVLVQSTGIQGNNSLATQMPIHTLWEFAADDYVELEVFQKSGGGLNVLAEALVSPRIWAVWVSG